MANQMDQYSSDSDSEVYKVIKKKSKTKPFSDYKVHPRTGKVKRNGEDVPDSTAQFAAHVITKIKDLTIELYPESMQQDEIFRTSNIKRVENNVITIDKVEMRRVTVIPNFFVSEYGNVFDIQSFRFVPDHLINAKLDIAHTVYIKDAEIYPKSLEVRHIFALNNLREVKDNKIKVDKEIMHRIPSSPHRFISSRHAFNINTFEYENWKIVTKNMTKQDIARIIMETNNYVYPLQTRQRFERIENMLSESNLVELPSSSTVSIDGIDYTQSRIPNILITENGHKFDLDNFMHLPGSSIQEKCQQIKNDTLHLFYPRSLVESKRFEPSNLIPVTDDNEIKIGKSIYTRHPVFPNLIGRRNKQTIVIFDLFEFKFLSSDEMAEVYELPFKLAGHETYEFKPGYVYNKSTNTINNEPMDWKEPIKTSPVSSIKYFHPVFTNNYIDFYGNAYHVSIDVDTDEIETYSISPKNGNITLYKDNGQTRFYNYYRFLYECFNQINVNENDYVVVLVDEKAKPLYRYCKWNLLMKTNEESDQDKIHRHRHPSKFASYAYDDRDKQVYSYFHKKVPTLIARNHKRAGYLTLTDENGKRITYPSERFIYECLNQVEVVDEDFVINGEVIPYGQQEIIYHGELFRVSIRPDFYIRANGFPDVFYTKYTKKVPVVNVGRTVHISKNCPDLNVPSRELVNDEVYETYRREWAEHFAPPDSDSE